MVKYPYLAPELIEGRVKENIKTDIYSIGSILLSIYDHYCLQLLSSEMSSKYCRIGTKCKSVTSDYDPHQRKSCKP